MMAYIEDNDLLIIMLRLFIALILSGLIGFEREMKRQSAGFRTHILVGVGACLMMILSLYGFDQFIDSDGKIRFDPARIPSYVISGIGFLGAGTIIVHGSNIRGLTTAASIWTVAGLGLVVGNGMYGAAIFTTVLILISLIFLNNIEKHFIKNSFGLIYIETSSRLSLQDIMSIFETHDVLIENIGIQTRDDYSQVVTFKIKNGKNFDKTALFEDVSALSDVKSVTEES